VGKHKSHVHVHRVDSGWVEIATMATKKELRERRGDRSLLLLPLERIAAAKLSPLHIAKALERADRPVAAAPAARRSNACSVLGFSPATTATATTVDWRFDDGAEGPSCSARKRILELRFLNLKAHYGLC